MTLDQRVETGWVLRIRKVALGAFRRRIGFPSLWVARPDAPDIPNFLRRDVGLPVQTPHRHWRDLL